jgi:hypothetical protein
MSKFFYFSIFVKKVLCNFSVQILECFQKKKSLKAFSHQRRAKSFNTLRSKAFVAKKPQSNLTKV